MATGVTSITREFKILNKHGIHARPAALFVKVVSQFQSDVTVEKEGAVASGKSIMGLLTLEGHADSVIRVTATGVDAEQALKAVEDLIQKKFFED